MKDKLKHYYLARYPCVCFFLAQVGGRVVLEDSSYGGHLGDGDGRSKRKMAETTDRHIDNTLEHVCMCEHVYTHIHRN